MQATATNRLTNNIKQSRTAMIAINDKNEFKELLKEAVNEALAEQEAFIKGFKLFTRKETAEMLNLSANYVGKLVRTGHLKSSKNNNNLITYESILKYVGK